VAGCCEYGDEPSGSGATELVSYVFNWIMEWVIVVVVVVVVVVVEVAVVIYLTTRFQTFWSNSVEWNGHNKWWILKNVEAVVAYFLELYRHLLEGTEQDHKKSQTV
jgi:hypothetical protein